MDIEWKGSWARKDSDETMRVRKGGMIKIGERSSNKDHVADGYLMLDLARTLAYSPSESKKACSESKLIKVWMLWIKWFFHVGVASIVCATGGCLWIF